VVLPAPDGPARWRQEERRRVNETVLLMNGHFEGLMFLALNSRIGWLSDGFIFVVDRDRGSKIPQFVVDRRR